MDEWYKEVYGLVERSQNDIRNSTKLREKMVAVRGKAYNEYHEQIEKTDYLYRKRIYEINREKNEVQYQLKLVSSLCSLSPLFCVTCIERNLPTDGGSHGKGYRRVDAS